MSSAKIQQLLNDTLNPSITKQAENQLINNRQNQGFLTQLLVIGDDQNINIQIRQSSLIYIKNAILDHYQGRIRIPQNDFQIIKSSILQALIRNCQEKLLTPTIREIIFILGQKQLGNWDSIIQQIVKIVGESGDFNSLFGGIEALKAIVSAYGSNANNKVALSNLCNKIVLPLLSFSSKLFQNYNSTTSPILLSIFKIFSTITYFHVPDIIMLNMHNWMIFIKKLLDLNITNSDNMDRTMYQLKKICLRILFRFYQRHFNIKNSQYSSDIVIGFHEKYTNGIVQSLLFQIMNQCQLIKSSSNSNKQRKVLELTKFSIACLSYIYEQYRPAAQLIDKYSEKIIYLCLQRYRFRGNKNNFGSYSQFLNILSEQRNHFCRFIISLLKNQTYLNYLIQQQNNANVEYSNFNSQQVGKVLGYLFNHIEKGDDQIKELCFYIFSDISTVLPGVDDQINDKMQMFILRYVKPLLQDNSTSLIIKLRCCQILTKYSYIHIPQQELTELGSGVYGCLISSNNNNSSSSMDIFLQIQAVHAFNSLLRYDFIVNFTSNSLSHILQVYTSLLEIEPSIIKCLEDLMDRFQNYLEPFGQKLIQMLGNMFFKYVNMYYNSQANSNLPANGIKSVYVKFRQNKSNQSQNDDQQLDDDDQFDNQEEVIENNYLVASKACLGAIRQIIIAPNFYLSNHSLIHNLLIHIFTDKDEFYTEEGFNILNLSLFKQKVIQPEYNLYFILIINTILPVSSSLVQALQKQSSSYASTLLKMLEINSSNPDEDIIQNTIGCLRNYIAKYGQKIRQQYDQAGTSFLGMIFNVVKYIHENQCANTSNSNSDDKQATESQRSIILTLYISLIQYNVITDDQMNGLLQQVGNWLNMQTQAVQSQQNQNNNSVPSIKITYTPIYIQIFLLAVHFYPKVSLGYINSQWIFNEILNNFNKFTCDYEVSRLLIGLADMLNAQFLNDQNISEKIVNHLPDLVQLQAQLRKDDGNRQIDVAKQDQAQEQDKFFGMDQNTHFMGLNRNLQVPQSQGSIYSNQHSQDNQMQSQSDQQQQWQDQFNKYYTSPLDSIDEIHYICDILKNQRCSAYMNLMSPNSQQKLSNIINNLVPKFNNQN